MLKELFISLNLELSGHSIFHLTILLSQPPFLCFVYGVNPGSVFRSLCCQELNLVSSKQSKSSAHWALSLALFLLLSKVLGEVRSRCGNRGDWAGELAGTVTMSLALHLVTGMFRQDCCLLPSMRVVLRMCKQHSIVFFAIPGWEALFGACLPFLQNFFLGPLPCQRTPGSPYVGESAAAWQTISEAAMKCTPHWP